MTLESLTIRMATMMDATVRTFEPLGTESRNALARVAMDAPEGRVRAILKTYAPEGDPHWANRFRREEKVLTLLASSRPAVAPKPIAGWIPAGGPAVLLMEDAGRECLADALARDGSPDLWREAARFLAGLHKAMAERKGPLRRTAMAIELDRIHAASLRQRMRTASLRVLGEAPDTGAERDLHAMLAPLLHAPREMIHNSMSLLNIVAGGDGWRAIDWETLTMASPAWDWAELLRAPYNPLTFHESERLFSEVSGLEGREGLFRRAAFSRHLDSLATVHRRRTFCLRDGLAERAEEYRRRAMFYTADLEFLAGALDIPPRLAAWWRRMMEGVMA